MGLPRLSLRRMKGSLYAVPVGAGSLVAVAAHADFAVAAGSLEIWARCSSLAGVANTANIFTLRIDDSNYLQFVMRVGTSLSGQFYMSATGVAAISAISTGYSFDNGGWHHAIATWAVGGVFLYGDGRQVGTQAGDKHTTWGSNPSLAIGGWTSLGNPFFGGYCAGRFYNRALTAAEAALRYQGIDIQTGLVSDWRCDDMSGLNVTDYKSGHVGVISDGTKILWTPQTPVKERVAR